RTPKGEAPISEAAGHVKIDDTERTRKIVIVRDDGGEDLSYPVSKRVRLLVEDGEHVAVGRQLVAGAVDPKKVLRILGPRAVQKHLVDQVQEVYRSQGVDIHDKHVEVIVRQMLRRVTVLDSGDSRLLPGELVERSRFEDENRRTVSEGGAPASGRPELMGISKASLATESWLSAASFQETTKVLTEAAMTGRKHPLPGLRATDVDGHPHGPARRGVLALCGLPAGDQQGAHGGGDARTQAPPAGPEGERHPRQAHPRRHRAAPVPEHRGRADRGGEDQGLRPDGLQRAGLRPGRFGPDHARGAGLRSRLLRRGLPGRVTACRGAASVPPHGTPRVTEVKPPRFDARNRGRVRDRKSVV